MLTLDHDGHANGCHIHVLPISALDRMEYTVFSIYCTIFSIEKSIHYTTEDSASPTRSYSWVSVMSYI